MFDINCFGPITHSDYENKQLVNNSMNNLMNNSRIAQMLCNK